MSSEDFVKKMGRTISASNLKKVNEIIENETKLFELFLTINEIQLDAFIDHVLEAYAEGGLIAAS
jgi:hypothetical protein